MEAIPDAITMTPQNLGDHMPENQTSHMLRMRRLALFRALERKVGDNLSRDELDIHFTHMPAHYWARANEDTVLHHLELIRNFFASLAQSGHDGTTPTIQ